MAARDARIFNFSAGPACMPEEVLDQLAADLWSVRGSGIGILEHSHRGPVFDGIIDDAVASCRRVGGIPDDFEILFLQGGATLQFVMLPMNFLPAGKTADYVDTGVWAHKARKEAEKLGTVNTAFDGLPSKHTFCPSDAELKLTDGAAYVHYCSNNTIYGTRFPKAPSVKAPLVCDMSSEMFARPIDWSRHVMAYAGAQKNLGPSGVVLVVIRKDFLATAKKDLPGILSYQEHAKNGSRLNTPNTFGIHCMGLMFKWIEKQGGLSAMARRNDEKAKVIYDAVDGSGGFYKAPARPDCRSVMNLVFRCHTEELDKKLLKEADTARMDGLKGHRDAGGLRASIYNAFPKAGCEALAQFMKEFARRNG
ncbi:MAG: 3-phosphoserine/phosphohydroxythreonine transaminase [Phycisphaerales bacterium]